MRRPRLEVFFDVSSPWTYLAFVEIEPLVQRTGAELIWKPILVGGVFNAVNESVYQNRANPNPVKARYSAKDLQDWARLRGLKIGMPPPVFPVKSVAAMRGAFFALEQGLLPAYCLALFRSYWGDHNDIGQEVFVREAARNAGLDDDALWAHATSEAGKSQLKATTDELIARGGFGSPTLFVNGDDMYFGNDRLVLVEAALRA
jgi:2-hydroxychromene-2-carboxylate isomerase